VKVKRKEGNRENDTEKRQKQGKKCLIKRRKERGVKKGKSKCSASVGHTELKWCRVN
jgi:hypothetical protein